MQQERRHEGRCIRREGPGRTEQGSSSFPPSDAGPALPAGGTAGLLSRDPGETGTGETALPLLASFEVFGNRWWSPSPLAEKSYSGLSPARVKEVDLQPFKSNHYTWEEQPRKWMIAVSQSHISRP